MGNDELTAESVGETREISETWCHAEVEVEEGPGALEAG